MVGDLNEGQTDEHTPAANFSPLFDPHGPLVACYELPGFNTGPRLGTFDSCDIEDRLDYIFVSRDLAPAVKGAASSATACGAAARPAQPHGTPTMR